MVDRLFSDADLAALYDAFHPSEKRGDFSFYLPMILAAGPVLDVGCGTGALLKLAREAGHTGRLYGLDPAEAMLQQARRRPDIEWVLGDLSTISWGREFDLVVMTGHAFQVFVEDGELRSSLAAIASILTADGRFAFETRNPEARAWDRWTPDNIAETTDTSGSLVRKREEVELVDDIAVRFTTRFESSAWSTPKVSRSTLRFVTPEVLSSFLSDAGLEIEMQFGDWDRQPVSDTTPEIVTIARRHEP